MEREWQKSDRLRRYYTQSYDAGAVEIAVFDESELALNVPHRDETTPRDLADVSFSPDTPLLQRSSLALSRSRKHRFELTGSIAFELPDSWQTAENTEKQLHGFVKHLKADLVFEDIEHRFFSPELLTIYDPIATQPITVSIHRQGTQGMAETHTLFTHKNTPDKHELHDGLVVGASIWAKLQNYIVRSSGHFSHLDEPILVGTTRDLQITDTELAFGTELTHSKLDNPHHEHPAMSEMIDWMAIETTAGSLSPAIIRHAIATLVHEKRIRYGIHGNMEPITQQDIESSLGIQ